MVRRDCPNCNKSWYSADAGKNWNCECGATLSKEHEVPLEGGSDYGQAARSSDRANKD